METERNTEDDCLSPKEQKVAVNFIWSQPDFSPEATVVDLILGHALGANNDIFEMYMEGTTLKENTPISEYRLDKMTDSSNCTSFDIKINLPKNSYQFLFRIEDVNNLISLAASESYKQIQLVSGRTINYLEIDDNYSITKEDKDEFMDVNESAPLVEGKRRKNGKREKGARCGCTPGNCSVL